MPDQNPWRPIITFASVVIFAATLFFLVFPTLIAPRFALMFKDFGGELPPLTRLVLSPWASLAALCFIAAGTAAGLYRARERAILLSLTAGGGIALLISYVAALYLPIFELASKIK